MNYYERHLGDYARDTAHLSLLEHGVYTLLLDRYYATEDPIPGDQAHRLARARTDEERSAVDVVLAEFFQKQETDDNPVGFVWVNRRVEEEIEKARQRISAARENGRKGGRPRKTPQNNPEETQEKPTGLSLGTPAETQPLTQTKAHQTPDTRHQTPVKKEKRADASARGSRLPTNWELPDDWRSWAESGRPDLDVTAEAEKFADYWHGAAGAKGRKADWAATWRNWIRNAHAPRGAPPPAASRPSASANFRGKTYAGTPIDQLPPDLRDAARAAVGDG